MDDLRYRLRRLEQSIMELKRGGSNRFSRPRSATNRRTVVVSPAVRTRPTSGVPTSPGGKGMDGEQGLAVNMSTMERRHTKLKGQLDKMERMLMTLVPHDQRDGGYDTSDEDSD